MRTGIYDRNRPFHTTVSPSMDILISSNLERLLFHFSGENDAEVRDYMDALARTGRYEVSGDIKAKLADEFWGGFCDGGGHRGHHRPLSERIRLSHRHPHRCGGGGDGAVPRRHQRRYAHRVRFHCQPL